MAQQGQAQSHSGNKGPQQRNKPAPHAEPGAIDRTTNPQGNSCRTTLYGYCQERPWQVGSKSGSTSVAGSASTNSRRRKESPPPKWYAARSTTPYKNVIKTERARAVEELAEMSADVPDDPEELYRVLQDTHGAPGIP